MKKIKVFEYQQCSTCKKAIQFLNKKGIEFERVSIVDHPPSVNELEQMLKYLGGDIKRLFNTSGVVYREMGLSEKLGHFSRIEALELLSKNGKLVKRPFALSSDKKGVVGFKEKEWEEFLR